MKKTNLSKFIKSFLKFAFILFIALQVTVTIIALVSDDSAEKKDITFNEFSEMTSNGNINSVYLNKDDLTLQAYTDDNTVYYETQYPDTDAFKTFLLENNVKIQLKNSSSSLFEIFLIPIIFILFICILSIVRTSKDKGNGESSASKLFKQAEPEILPINSSVTFKDVAGIDEAKENLYEIVEYLKKPNKLYALGINAPSGILLDGPSGTGKTLLAKAVAGEANVPFYSLCGSDFVQMFVGVGASRVRNLFETARKNSPCVIFIDEIDSLLKVRNSSGGGGDSEREQTVNAFLVEMDGFKNNSGIIIIGATNRKDMIDPAALRAGRFDRHVFVDLPDIKGREEILKIHGKNKPFDETVDLKKVSKLTTHFSGADLENLLNESGWNALRNNRKYISMDDILYAFETVIAGARKKRSILSEKERKIVAYHESGHALVTKLMAKEVVQKITICSTTGALGYVMSGAKDNVLSTKKDLLNDICILFAGRAAEELIFGKNEVTNGATNDFEKATRKAYAMVFDFGMSDLGQISLNSKTQEIWSRLSDDIKNKGFKEVEKILEQCKKEVDTFLLENRHELERLANHLLEVETMYEDEFNEFMNHSLTQSEVMKAPVIA